jgi:glycosyltransferase involved in cell wall biosynthesis
MNILFVNNLYPPNEVGGYERLCFDTASALAGRNHRISVLTSNYGGQLEDYPGQEVDRSLQLLADAKDIYKYHSASGAQKKIINAHNIAALERKLKEVRPDILFVWNLFFFDRSFLYAIQSSGCRTVYLLTDNWMILLLRPLFWYRYFARDVLSSRFWQAAIFAVLERLMVRTRMEKLTIHGEAIFPSRFMKLLYEQAGFKFRSTAIIPHGIRLVRHLDEEYRDRSAPVEKGWLRLLFAGRVVEIKGVHTILEALPEIIRRLPETCVRLTVLGDTRDSAYMKKIITMIERLDLVGKVEFLPPIQESKLFGFFQTHDIFLFPSLYEPLSLTLLHAVASGIPVVASNVGGNIEIVFPERTGLLFSKGDPRSLAEAVVDLAGKPTLRRKLAVEAKRAAQAYSAQAMIRKVEAFLSGTGNMYSK